LFFKILEQLGDQIDLEREKNNVFGMTDEYDSSYKTQTIEYHKVNNTYSNNVYNNQGKIGAMGMNQMSTVNNYNPMTMQNSIMYQQNSYYKPPMGNSYGNAVSYSQFYPQQFDMSRFHYGNFQNDGDMNYISGNIVSN